jgi:hypothetical protein
VPVEGGGVKPLQLPPFHEERPQLLRRLTVAPAAVEEIGATVWLVLQPTRVFEL